MTLSILLYSYQYRGDHSADVVYAHEVREGETVEEMASRLLKYPYERIEIRLVQELKEAT